MWGVIRLIEFQIFVCLFLCIEEVSFFKFVILYLHFKQIHVADSRRSAIYPYMASFPFERYSSTAEKSFWVLIIWCDYLHTLTLSKQNSKTKEKLEFYYMRHCMFVCNQFLLCFGFYQLSWYQRVLKLLADTEVLKKIIEESV